MALVLELYWVVGNPCINMVQSYRLVGPIYRHQLLCYDLEYQEDNTQKLRYQWSPNGTAACGQTIGSVFCFLDIPNHEYLSEYRHHWSNGNRGGNGVLSW